ncbi:MAG: DUF58 domain-containing protein [Planctomycetes bacterium]|nr:DUF58 domain-containing protein [Planctomycetota bacterium]
MPQAVVGRSGDPEGRRRVERYLDPEVIRQVERLDLKARFIVEGFLAGIHVSPFQGFSVEFSEHRKYTTGDDIRTVDWTVFAKTDKLYVKKYEAETTMECHLVVDTSGSMAYSYGKGVTKFEYAIYLAAALSFLMIHQQDSVGLVTFSERLHQYLRPRSKRSHLMTLLAELARVAPHGESNIAECLHQTAGLIHTRGLIIVMSDLLSDPEPVQQALHHLKFEGHDIILFHILDHAETNFPFEGAHRFREPETGDELQVDASAYREAYLQAIDDFIAEYRDRCLQAKIDYAQMDTSVPFDRALTTFLINRSQYNL